jgi:hypothetical protein
MANTKKANRKPYSERWALIQIPRETHDMLKEYANEHGYIMSALVSKMIKKFIQSN